MNVFRCVKFSQVRRFPLIIYWLMRSSRRLVSFEFLLFKFRRQYRFGVSWIIGVNKICRKKLNIENYLIRFSRFRVCAFLYISRFFFLSPAFSSSYFLSISIFFLFFYLKDSPLSLLSLIFKFLLQFLLSSF